MACSPGEKALRLIQWRACCGDMAEHACTGLGSGPVPLLRLAPRPRTGAGKPPRRALTHTCM